MGKILKISLAVIALAGLGMIQSAKADVISTGTGTATTDTFTGVQVYGATGSASTNPFGTLAGTCPGTLVQCTQSEFGTGNYEVATIEFFSGGGFTLTETGTGTSAPPASVSASQDTALTTLSGFCAAAGPSIFTTGASALTVATGTECTTGGSFTVNGNSQAGGSVLEYLGGGEFALTDNSFEVVFSLTPSTAPEPASLLLLGSGLLGLAGFGWRRKRSA
jgi:hypothetical protein